MYVAYDSKDEAWNALDDKIEKEREYHCPICGGKVIFKQGKKIQSHFAHAKNCSCQYETYKKEIAKGATLPSMQLGAELQTLFLSAKINNKIQTPNN